MGNTSTYLIAKCCHDKSCPKCSSISNAIVVKRGSRYTLYCADCGGYIKRVDKDDRRYIYLARETVKDLTPMKVAMLYAESSKTITGRLK